MVGNNCAWLCFSKTLSPRLRTIIQVVLISILNVLARMVFFQAYLFKKKKNRSATTWCPPITSLSLYLCVHRKTNWKQKAMKNKDKKARITLELHYPRKWPGKSASHSKNGTIFKRWQKWPFCKGYSKAKWSQMVYTGTEPQNTKNIQNLPFKFIRVVLCRKLLKTHFILEKWLDVEKWQNWPFSKGHSKAKWQEPTSRSLQLPY